MLDGVFVIGIDDYYVDVVGNVFWVGWDCFGDVVDCCVCCVDYYVLCVGCVW